jgi:hypothetical protein
MVVVFGGDCALGGCWAGGALELLLLGLKFGLMGLVGSVGCLGGEGCLDICRLLSFGNGRQDESASLVVSLCVHWVFVQECRASASYVVSPILVFVADWA